jgi:uncharacterized protein (DUF362 family)/Pyruvate/2-oxoacid:ferredoxin oxidoreductase delta subunit
MPETGIIKFLGYFMNKTVAVRKCQIYEVQTISEIIADIYETCKGPDVKDKKVLLKPNILTDSDPSRCICTHPVVVESMVRYLQSKGATVFIGDSPAVHLRGFNGEKSGIRQVCDKTGAIWVDFMKEPTEKKLRKGRIKIASIADKVDLIVSLPKFKNHELVYFTGAIKNTLGIVPGFSKAKQHAYHQDRDRFSTFLIELNELIMPGFFLMDGIIGMEGPGPGQGTPFATGVLAGSSNPVALDIIASSIAGYDPLVIPTTAIAIATKDWLASKDEIIYDGPELSTLVKHEFKRIPISKFTNIALKFIITRLRFMRKFEKRPVFIRASCTGCLECINICPEMAISMHPTKTNKVNLSDDKCIRCFCCSEVCQSNAIKIRRKFLGE